MNSNESDSGAHQYVFYALISHNAKRHMRFIFHINFSWFFFTDVLFTYNSEGAIYVEKFSDTKLLNILLQSL